MSTIIPDPPEPTIRAVVEFPPGLDQTRISVVDGDTVIAETTWRATTYDKPGPSTWDWALHRLGFDRRSPWRPDEFGFGCEVERIAR